MTAMPQARDFIDTPRITTPRTMVQEFRRIAAQCADEPPHVLIEKMANTLADYLEHEMRMKDLGRG